MRGVVAPPSHKDVQTPTLRLARAAVEEIAPPLSPAFTDSANAQRGQPASSRNFWLKSWTISPIQGHRLSREAELASGPSVGTVSM